MEAPEVFDDPTLEARLKSRLLSRPAKSIELENWTPAAVLLLLYPRLGARRILLTVRTDLVEHHKGQVSFPGGAAECEDTDLESTALRETYEEVGVPPDDVEILGRLDDIITVSNYRVTPVVGTLRWEPNGFRMNHREVAEVLEVPLAHLLDPANQLEDLRERNGTVSRAPAYEYNGRRIWGATARMLREFLRLLED